MPQTPEAVFFDVDGVLIDSLAAHLRFCEVRAKSASLSIRMPSIQEFRDLAMSGRKINPMREFFSAVGFPEGLIDASVKDYEANFANESQLGAFDGVAEVLAILRKSGIKLGLITSNVRKNVETVLGDETMKLFEPAALFFHEVGIPKSRQIERAAAALQVDVRRCVFVGDLPADEIAANDAGSIFVGVTYGWGFADGGQNFETAANVFAIPMAVQRATCEFSNTLQFDYAWKWLSFHADQRVKMFNYMFVGLGLIANALVASFGKGLSSVQSALLCFLATILALIFFILDIRNQYLVHLGEDVLFEMEKRAIFGIGRPIRTLQGNEAKFGILSRQEAEYPGHCLFRDAVQGRHRVWLKFVALLFAAGFLLAGVILVFGNVQKMQYGD